MLLRFFAGAFLVLHGLVHLLYFGQSQRFFQLQPGMAWPDGSWAFSSLLGEGTTRLLAAVSCLLAALGLVVGGSALLAKQAWWRPLIVGAAAFSTLIWVLFWNGRLQKLGNQGIFAVLINLAILIVVLIVRWPALQP